VRGLVISPGGVRYQSDLPRPKRASGECRVRVRSAGICATDLALARGYMGFQGVPGHEFVGVALEGPLAGERVVGAINAGCGVCVDCCGGDARHCPERSVLGILGRSGAFAEELVLPAANLYAVPAALGDAAAVFAEPVAAALEIVEQVRLSSSLRALVIGDGRLGLLCAQVLAGEVGEVHVAGRHPERAPLSGGAVHLGELAAGAVPARERYDLVVEASGNPDVLQRALGAVRPRGTLVLKTTSERPALVDLAPLVVDEITLLGSRCGPMKRALEELAAGRIVVQAMIHARFPLSEGERAFARAGEPGTLKVLIDMPGASA
jgi:2-desacetyl-2-hydroxyethyl bacteriochlorophyllide A dehydrogenase